MISLSSFQVPKSECPREPTGITSPVPWLAFCAFAVFLALNAVALVLIRLKAGVPASTLGYALFVVIPGVPLTVLLVFLVRRKTVVYSYILALIIAFYGAQEYSLWKFPKDKFDAVRQARGRGIDAVPSVHPLVFLWKDAGAIFERWESEELSLPLINGRSVLPLGGISKATTYYCNEADPFLVYESDRYGFNNPDAVWDHPIEIAFVGDSFTQGACVPTEKHFTGILRQTFPGLLNLGMGGSGPLAALATFQEYVVDLRPKHVFWLYFEGNDILVRPDYEVQGGASDIEREFTIPILSSYLKDPEFRQGLKRRQTQVDSALRSIVETAFSAERARRDGRYGKWGSFYQPFAEKIILAPLAKRIFAALPKKHRAFARSANSSILGGPAERIQGNPANSSASSLPKEAAGRDLSALRLVLQRMQTTVARWNGHFHLIYLPDIAHFRFGAHPLREEVLSIASDLGISVIDMVPPFEAERDPQDLFAFGVQGGHYNARGYALVARAIGENLSTGRVASTNR